MCSNCVSNKRPGICLRYARVRQQSMSTTMLGRAQDNKANDMDGTCLDHAMLNQASTRSAYFNQSMMEVTILEMVGKTCENQGT